MAHTKCKEVRRKQ